jgi:hypothetical protein
MAALTFELFLPALRLTLVADLCLFDKFSNLRRGIAPAWRATSKPFSNNVIVGMAETRKRRPRDGTSSVFTFATSKRPAVSLATFRTSGATILHGPHHGAQKSTSTGTLEWFTRASKARSW